MPDEQEFLQAMYKEQCDQARQHENLRQQSTTIVLGISAAIIAAVSATAANAISALANAHALWLFGFYAIFGMFIIVLGRFGRSFSLQHYERNRFHSERAGEYRERLERMFPAGHYEQLREDAKEKHRTKWRERMTGQEKALAEGYLYTTWKNIYLFLIWSGTLLTAAALLIAVVGLQW
jgi:hypothetical protein